MKKLVLIALLSIVVPALGVGIASGDWMRAADRSPETDFQNVRYTLPALTVVDVEDGEATWPSLVVECQDNHTAMYVDWQQPVAAAEAGARHRVRYQVDFRGIRRGTWSFSDDGNKLGLWQGAPISLLRRMKGGHFMLVGTTSNGQEIYAAFDLENFDRIAGDVARHCNWRF